MTFQFLLPLQHLLALRMLAAEDGTAGNVDLPCLGVFEMRDGRIAEWRDYFDLGTFMKAMQG